MKKLVAVLLLINMSTFAQAGASQLQMSGTITEGTSLQASVMMLATNSFFTCESTNAGGWPTPKTSSVTAQATVVNGTYTLQAQLDPGSCGYEAKSIELYITSSPSAYSNVQAIGVNDPLAGTPGYDDIASVSALNCQTTQTSSSGLGIPCAVVKTDGSSLGNDQLTVGESELNGPIHLNVITHP